MGVYKDKGLQQMEKGASFWWFPPQITCNPRQMDRFARFPVASSVKSKLAWIAGPPNAKAAKSRCSEPPSSARQFGATEARASGICSWSRRGPWPPRNCTSSLCRGGPNHFWAQPFLEFMTTFAHFCSSSFGFPPKTHRIFVFVWRLGHPVRPGRRRSRKRNTALTSRLGSRRASRRPAADRPGRTGEPRKPLPKFGPPDLSTIGQRIFRL